MKAKKKKKKPVPCTHIWQLTTPNSSSSRDLPPLASTSSCSHLCIHIIKTKKLKTSKTKTRLLKLLFYLVAFVWKSTHSRCARPGSSTPTQTYSLASWPFNREATSPLWASPFIQLAHTVCPLCSKPKDTKIAFINCPLL